MIRPIALRRLVHLTQMCNRCLNYMRWSLEGLVPLVCLNSYNVTFITRNLSPSLLI